MRRVDVRQYPVGTGLAGPRQINTGDWQLPGIECRLAQTNHHAGFVMQALLVVADGPSIKRIARVSVGHEQIEAVDPRARPRGRFLKEMRHVRGVR